MCTVDSMVRPKGHSSFVCCALLFFIIIFVPVSAAHADSPFKKLGRGITNVGLSPLELFIQPIRNQAEAQSEHVPLVAGIPQGLYYVFARIVSGAYDVVTFPVPLPKAYGPIMQPETVLEGLTVVSEEQQWPYPKYGFF